MGQTRELHKKESVQKTTENRLISQTKKTTNDKVEGLPSAWVGNATSYDRPVSNRAQVNKYHSRKENHSMGNESDKFIVYRSHLDAFVVDTVALQEVYPEGILDKVTRYYETACRFKNRAYNGNTDDLDKRVREYMSHLEPKILSSIRTEVHRPYGNVPIKQILDFDEVVESCIHDILTIIMGNRTKHVMMRRLYKDLYPYLQVGSLSNIFDPQMPTRLSNDMQEMRITPRDIRVYRLLIKEPETPRKYLISMEDILTARRKAEEYYENRLLDVPALMMVTRPESIPIVKKHIYWYKPEADRDEFDMYDIPLISKFGRIHLSDGTSMRILLSKNIHLQTSPKIIDEARAYVYVENLWGTGIAKRKYSSNQEEEA